jgi:predicted O-linked N-acetylglucosamine transferase (SPINDLY family)
MKVADWTGLDDDVEQARRAMADGHDCVVPFVMTGLPFSAAEQRAAAERFARPFMASALPAPSAPPTRADGRLRVGYLSSDFRVHPMAFAMARLYELHDRAQFEVIGISIGADDGSAIRQRLVAAFDHFVDGTAMTDAALAQAIRGLQVDILIDLNGYTDLARPGVLALRPAPLQISYLGYPGTLGAPFIDHLVADATLIPEAERQHYSEKILYLPGSYQANDDQRELPGPPPPRAECGLPEGAFVFCCFNDAFKVMPPVFDVWMRLLQQVPGSVLWLPSRHADHQANLRAEALRRGVDASRLVFAPYVDIHQHWRRLPLADLFLDTLPYNAHGTGSDALWAGLPLVTCTGSTFAGRVGASLLRAVGLDELVTDSLPAYEALALALARDPVRLQALRDRLSGQARSRTLFDSARFTRQLEDGYRQAWALQQAGQGLDHVVVSAG